VTASTGATQGTGHIADGADGAGLARRVYRRTPIRWLHNIWWDHRGLREIDVMLSSYPRSGSTWSRFLLYALAADAPTTFASVNKDVPLIGRHMGATPLLADGGRLIKTHEPFMKRYHRVIHIVRDPRDMAVSYWHFMIRIGKIRPRPDDDMGASFDHFIDALIAGRIDGFTNWRTHTRSYLAAAERLPESVVRVRYEDMHADTPGALRVIGEFLGLKVSDEQAALAAERASIEHMREAEDLAVATEETKFARQGRRTGIRAVRAGEVGGYRAAMNESQVRKFDVFAAEMERLGYSRS